MKGTGWIFLTLWPLISQWFAWTATEDPHWIFPQSPWMCFHLSLLPRLRHCLLRLHRPVAEN